MSASGAPAVHPQKSNAIPSAPRDKAIASLCALLLLIGLPIAWFSESGPANDFQLAVVVLLNLALLAGIFLWFVPEERVISTRTARSALITGIVACLLLGILWTGLVFPVGAGAIALGMGMHTRATEPIDARATAGAALGAIAVVTGFVLLLLG